MKLILSWLQETQPDFLQRLNAAPSSRFWRNLDVYIADDTAPIYIPNATQLDEDSEIDEPEPLEASERKQVVSIYTQSHAEEKTELRLGVDHMCPCVCVWRMCVSVCTWICVGVHVCMCV